MNLVPFEVNGGRLTFTLGGDCSILLSYGNKGIFRGFNALKIGIIFWFHN